MVLLETLALLASIGAAAPAAERPAPVATAAAESGRYRGFRGTFKTGPDKVASQGAVHLFCFRDRRGEDVDYVLILNGPAPTAQAVYDDVKTNRRGRDVIDATEIVNLFPGEWRAVWKVGGVRVARFGFRVRDEG